MNPAHFLSDLFGSVKSKVACSFILQRTLSLGPGPQTLYATCCAYNHNGQLLVVGCSDGTVRTVDLRHSEVIDCWSGHQGAVTALQLTPDQNYCYSLGQDNKVSENVCLNPSNCYLFSTFKRSYHEVYRRLAVTFINKTS